MRTLFDSGFRKVMGQYNYGWGYPYNRVQQTPSATPAVPRPPSIPAEVAKPVDISTRISLMSKIRTARANHQAVAAWWDQNSATEEGQVAPARELLGNRFPEYQQYLTDTVANESLAAALEHRLGQEGDVLIYDSEIAAVDMYDKSAQSLHDLVFGGSVEPGVASPTERKIWIPAIVAAGAFITASII